MNKILFLDFDGPLFSDRGIRFHPLNEEKYPGDLNIDPSRYGQLTYWKMDDTSVEMLNRLHKLHPFMTVVSSSWKKFCEKNFIEELFYINCLKLPLHDDWKTTNITFRSCRRMEEINDWIETHPDTDDYIVLDDPWSGGSIDTYRREHKHYPEEFKLVNPDNILIVDPTTGLEIAHYHKMYNIVERWAGKTKEQQDQEENERMRVLNAFIW